MAAITMRSLVRDRGRAKGLAKMEPLPRPMTRADICNVEPIHLDELARYLRAMGLDAGDDERWALTVEGMTCR